MKYDSDFFRNTSVLLFATLHPVPHSSLYSAIYCVMSVKEKRLL